MSDLISRADAIDAVEGLTKYMEKLVEGAEKFPETHTKNYKHDMEQQIVGVAHASQVILELPSADATVGDYPNDVISRNALMEYCSNQKSKSIDNNDIARFPSADTIPIEKYHELQHQFVMLGATFADLTDVVRCKDCRHAYFKDFDKYCPYMVGALKPDGYCHYGKRRQP